MKADHDTGYKLLFSHPELVRDLLLEYVPGEWVNEADFSTLERINASYVAKNLKQRHDDIVWRLRLKDRWLWVYLVLEFQSEPDPWMALRMLAYVALLAQDIIRRNEVFDNKLPPILPLVLYNGLTEWRASREVSQLFVPAPPGLEPFQPRLLYHLIDEARLKQHPSAAVRNLASALFQLEHSRSPADLRRIIQSLGTLLAEPERAELRQSFTVWIKRLLRRKIHVAKAEEIDSINDLMEADTMLAERIESWFEEAAHKGMQHGLQKGTQQGLQQGLLLGKEQGVELGRQEGQVQLLSRILTRRFGLLPSTLTDKLHRADLSQLETWGDRVLDAVSLDEVFRDH